MQTRLGLRRHALWCLARPKRAGPVCSLCRQVRLVLESTGHPLVWIAAADAAGMASPFLRVLAGIPPMVAALMILCLPGLGVASQSRVPLLDLLPAHWLDDQGRALDLHLLAGQRLVFTMAYASCHRVCPMTLRRLQQLQLELDTHGANATFVIVGYDPERSDPAAWHQYRRERGLTRANWLFLTAAGQAQVREFAVRLGFEFWKYDEHVMHDSRVVVIDPQGNLQESFGPGSTLDVSSIAGDRPAIESRRHSADLQGT